MKKGGGAPKCFVSVDLAQLDHIVPSWRAYYNSRWLQRGIGKNNEILNEAIRPQTYGTVQCEQQIGGIRKSYYRDVA